MTIDQVATYASSLPGVVEGAKHGKRTWMVGDRSVLWQRPFRKADLKRFGDETRAAGDIVAVSVENLDAKDALLAIGAPGFFTIPHFDGYAAVLIELRAARVRDVRAAIVDAWRCVAPEEPEAPAKKPAK